MRTVILVPRREGFADRDALWTWCKARWEQYHPDWTIYEGHHDEGPFNRSAAINLAARLADEDGPWAYAIVIDADIFIKAPQVKAAVKRAQSTGRVTWAHTRWRGLSQEWTHRLVNPRTLRDLGAEIESIDMDVLVEKTNPISWSCCIVFPRKVWDAVGGFDERFVGWGFEDNALRSLVCGLHGWERLPGDVYHLNHDRVYGSGRASKEAGEYTPEAVTNARLGRRYMIAVLRDHGIGDQTGQEHLSPEEAAVHIRNLRKDDDKLAVYASRHNMPDWSDWWPDLAELNAGAKLHAARARSGTVTLVVHTGGMPDAWPERQEYLVRSMASLDEQVSGPIVQRVIYDCWGDGAIRDWLAETFGPHGFYVVGPEQPVDFTGSMQMMWRYLDRRAKGDFIFAVEDDFIYTRPVDLEPMIRVLRSNPHLAQIALLRDPCYQDEKETGGILGWPEPAFTRRSDWLEHRLFWTNNPALFRRSVTSTAWPNGHHSETQFGKVLLTDKRVRFAFWGQGEEWIQHIGAVRAGVGY